MRDPTDLSLDEIENIEKLSLRALFVAAADFGMDASDVFYQSNDDPKDVAEDVTREMLDRVGGYGVPQRIFGNVDYRKARYVILPDFSIRQALFVGSKAEKSASSASLQMSQLSMEVRQHRQNSVVDVPGKIGAIEEYAGKSYLSTILLTHYHYDASANGTGRDVPPYRLLKLTMAAIPNGKLQDRYNPSHSDTIWLAGQNAPSLGEDFRVRLSFSALKLKAKWRVQTIKFDSNTRSIFAEWVE